MKTTRTHEAVAVVDDVILRALVSALADRKWGVVKVLAGELEVRGPLSAVVAAATEKPPPKEKKRHIPASGPKPKPRGKVTYQQVLMTMRSRVVHATSELAIAVYGDAESATLNKLGAHLTSMKRRGLVSNPKHGFWAAKPRETHPVSEVVTDP